MGIQGIQEKLPEGWHWVRCQDVIDVRDGTHDTPKYVTQGIPLITSKNLTRGFLDFSDIFFISEADHEHIKKRSKVDKGDIIMPMIGTIGNPVLVDTAKEFSIKNVALFKFQNSSVFSPFFYYLLQSPLIVNKLAADAQGGTQQFVSLGNLRDLQIPLPPLAEQKRIAAIAQKADRLRRTRRYALQLSDTYLQSVFLEMFGDYLTQEYPNTPLSELVTISGGGTPSREVAAYYEGDIPWITAKDMQWDYIIDAQEHITEEAIKKSATKLIPKGSILMVVKSKVLMHRLPLAIAKRELCHNQDIKSVQCSNKVHPYFILYILKYNEPQLLRQARGANTEGLTLPMLEAVPVPDVALPLQEKFAQIVQKFERLRTQQREGDRQAEHLFQTLLHRAFRGELTSQDTNDEPASVLLEQIGAEQAQAEAEAKAATQAVGDAAEYLGTKAKQQDTEPIQLTLPGLE
ncbi:MAG TPA: restriction endonuclease subunit S [Stenomitos sp.]